MLVCVYNNKKNKYYYSGTTLENGKKVATYVTEKEYKNGATIQPVLALGEYLRYAKKTDWRVIELIKEV